MDGYGPPPFHPPPISTSAALTATPTSSSSSSHPQQEQQTTPTTVSFHSADSPPARATAGINSAYAAPPQPAPSSSPSSLSSAIAALSKAELIAQLQQARQQAQREADDRRTREDQQRKAALEAELSALSAAVASKQDVVALHAAAAAELASKQASHSALKQEILRLQEAMEAERLRKERLQAQQQMEVTVLRQALEAERLDQERQARLLAARIAAVKMEIQERKAKYRARKQQDMQRAERAAAAAAAVEQQQQLDDRQDSELALLKKQREQMERELQTAQQGGVLKPFALDSISPMLWPGSPANPWHEPEACIRHVLRVDADFNIIAQPDHRRVRIKEMPFAKGGLRLAFFCEDITVPSHPFRLVAKESCYAGPKANSLSNFYNDVRSQLVARTFAERFNSLSPPKLVQFLLPMIYEFPFRSSPDRRYMAVELFMSGQYVKYSDNVQYVNSQFRTIPAFCHWSYASSGGQMMITDLQGVNYILTDPQVHSSHPSAEFGLGGGDEQAMSEFFAQHRCNEICQALGLQPHREQQRGGAAGLQHDDDGMTRAGMQYASEVMGECGHVFILQVAERKDFISNRGRMLCPDCRINTNAVPFFPPER